MTKILLISLLSVNSFAATEVGKLVLVNGTVAIAKSEEDAGRPVKPTDAIQNDDIVKTSDGSTAKILFTDQSVMDLGPNSAFKVSNYALKNGDDRTGSFSLIYGKVRALVTKKVGPGGKVEVRSGQTVMGVRGTEFMVDTPKGANNVASSVTTVVVVAGSVAVTPPNGGAPVMVGPGQMMTAAPLVANPTNTTSSAPTATDSSIPASESSTAQVQSVGTEQAQSIVSSVKADDNTFVGSVNLAPSPNQSGATPNNAMASMGSLVSTSVAVPPPASESGKLPPPVQTMGVNTNFLPPVNIIPGNRVQLSVVVQ